MAIEPKSPRKRAVKKSSKKSLGVPTVDTTADGAESAASETEAAPKSRKKAAAIPVPVFQAAPADAVAPKRATKAAKKTR